MKRILVLMFLCSFFGCSGGSAPGGIGLVKGTVLLENGSSVAGIKIEIPGTSYVAFTDSQGNFELSYIPTGVYTLKAHMIGFVNHLYWGVLVTDSATTTLPTKTLVKIPGSLTVHGTVTINSFAPLDRLEALLEPSIPNDDRDVFRVTANDGTFRIDGVTPGKYRLYVGDRVYWGGSGMPGTSNGAVSTYKADIVVTDKDLNLGNITVQPGASETNLGFTTLDNGFDFDSGTFNPDPSQNDLFIDSWIDNAGQTSFLMHSNGNNLALLAAEASMTDLHDFARVPDSGFVSSLIVKAGEFFVVRTTRGNFAKMYVEGYGSSDGKQLISLRWQLQPDGVTVFDY